MNVCAICLEKLRKSADTEIALGPLGLLRDCQHVFHFDCIWRWLEVQKRCPLCRIQVTLSTTDIIALTSDCIKWEDHKSKHKRSSLNRQNFSITSSRDSSMSSSVNHKLDRSYFRHDKSVTSPLSMTTSSVGRTNRRSRNSREIRPARRITHPVLNGRPSGSGVMASTLPGHSGTNGRTLILPVGVHRSHRGQLPHMMHGYRQTRPVHVKRLQSRGSVHNVPGNSPL